MKFLKITFLLVAVGLLFSCKEEENPLVNDGIAGVWKVSGIEYSGVTTAIIEGEELKNTYRGVGSDMNLTLQMKESPNEYVSSGGYTITLYLDYAGQEMDIPVVIDGFMGSGIWRLDGDVLTVTQADQTVQSCKIVSLEEEELVIDFSESIVQNYMGVVVNNIIDGTVHFKR